MKLVKKLLSTRWEIGFVKNTMADIVEGKPLQYQWVKNPFKGHWFADPFILDVTDDEIFVLVEDMPTPAVKASLAKLTISRKSFEITKRDVILDLPSHLSFPNIVRYKGKIYVYPENVYGGKLNIYEYDEKQNKLVFAATLLDEEVWDSVITEDFGEPLLFTANKDDYHLDIYKWNEAGKTFEYWQSVESDHRNMRMAGKLFKIGDKIYCPSQNSDRSYGDATEIKEVTYSDGKFTFNTIRTLTSSHPTLKEGMHTLNEYKGVIVIDVIGYNYPCVAKILLAVRKLIKG